MKLLASHHISPETLLPTSIIGGLLLGVFFGYTAGSALGNTGVGISLGALFGLISGVAVGFMLSKEED
ncbi:hypothetical protein ACFL6K_02475 [Candidatus Latescibacterota bacterium]